MNTLLREKGAALEAKRQAAKEFFDGFKAVGDAQAKAMSAADVATFNAMLDEVSALQTEFDGLRKAHEGDRANREALADGRKAMEFDRSGPPLLKSVGRRFIESAQYKGRGSDGKIESVSLPDFDWKEAIAEFKTTMSTSAGWAPFVNRQPGWTPSIQRPIQVIDTLPMRRTSENSIKFMKETTLTNNAAAATESGAAGEAALAFTETSSTIERVAVFLPVTQIQLDDEPGLEDILNERLTYMVLTKLDGYCMTGTGTPPQIYGLSTLASVQTQARGTDNEFDAIHKAITLVRVTGRANPNVIYMHSGDWQQIRLLRTADGVYILGNPSDAVQPRLWGLPVVVTETLSENTALVGDTSFATLVMRSGVDIAVSDSHASLFISGVLAIRATVRAGLEVRRDEAFCKVTSL